MGDSTLPPITIGALYHFTTGILAWWRQRSVPFCHQLGGEKDNCAFGPIIADPGMLDARMHCARKCRAQNHKLFFEFVKLEQLPRYILCNCDLLALSCSLLGECRAPCIDGCRV